jgi:translation elongation factor EF-G
MQPFSSRLYDITTRSLVKSPTQNRLVAVARVFSGQVSVGQKVYVLGPHHSPESPEITETVIQHLFLLMGSTFSLIHTATAGCVIGIGGLDDIIIKSGTITSDP